MSQAALVVAVDEVLDSPSRNILRRHSEASGSPKRSSFAETRSCNRTATVDHSNVSDSLVLVLHLFFTFVEKLSVPCAIRARLSPREACEALTRTCESQTARALYCFSPNSHADLNSWKSLRSRTHGQLSATSMRISGVSVPRRIQSHKFLPVRASHSTGTKERAVPLLLSPCARDESLSLPICYFGVCSNFCAISVAHLLASLIHACRHVLHSQDSKTAGAVSADCPEPMQ